MAISNILKFQAKNKEEEHKETEEREEEHKKIDENEEKPQDKITELPVKLSSLKKGRKMKKSVSLNYTGPGGIEAVFPTPKKKNKNKKKN